MQKPVAGSWVAAVWWRSDQGVCALAGSSAPRDDGDATPTATNREQIETATVCLVNAEPDAHGLEPLRPDRRLDQAAHAQRRYAGPRLSPTRAPTARHPSYRAETRAEF